MPILRSIKSHERPQLPRSSMSTIWNTSFGPTSLDTVNFHQTSNLNHPSAHQTLVSRLPSLPFGSSDNETVAQQYPTPNPYNDPMSEISSVESEQVQPRGLGRILSRYRIGAMVDKSMRLRRFFITALVVLQVAVLSTTAAITMMFQELKVGIKAGVAAWLVVSLIISFGAAVCAVVMYWKREKLRGHGQENVELQNQQRGGDGRITQERADELEGRNVFLSKQVQAAEKRLREIKSKLQLPGQEDIEMDTLSPPANENSNSRARVSGSMPTAMISLPTLHFDVDPQHNTRQLPNSRSNNLRQDGFEDVNLGRNFAEYPEYATVNGTEGWETVESDGLTREGSMVAEERVNRTQSVGAKTLRSMSHQERLRYFESKRERVGAQFM